MPRSPGPAVAVALSHVEPQVGPHLERLLELAREVEAAGADSLVLSEHVLLADVITGHPGTASSFPFPGTEQYPEPLVTLGAIAAVTSRVRLSTNILIAPLRPAGLLAKQMATLDCLSNGRLELGLGTGWHQPEYAAIGVPMEKLPQRLDDTVRACRALWSSRPASFSSPTVSFTGMYCCPAPVQDPLPLWIGGDANRGMARRVAELGQGWTPMGGDDPDLIRAGLALIREACERIGRHPAGIGVRASIFPPRDAAPAERVRRMLERVPPLVEAGVTCVQVPLPNLAPRVDDAREVIAEVVAGTRALAGAAG
jgi:probable F420-dependent oxidoreductase